ncbi:MAG: hemolysin III family protein [Nocardioidaceae bacterium]
MANTTYVRPGKGLHPRSAGGKAGAGAAATAAAVLAEVRPRLRGKLHAATAPLTLAGGIALVSLSPPGVPRLGSLVFALSALVMFSVSATMHRGGWSRRTEMVLTRLDHASIFLLIAGTYTPFALLLLTGTDRIVLLSVAWGGAAAGITFRLLRPQAARWVYTPLYMALGWVAIVYVSDFARYAAWPVLALIALGGLMYTAGGVVYGLRRPNPVPHLFGFHEIFHACTVVAFAAHYAGVSIATYSLR